MTPGSNATKSITTPIDMTPGSNAAKSTTTTTNMTTPGPDAAKSTTTTTNMTTPGPDAAKSTTSTTNATPATEPTSTIKSATTTSATPGVEAARTVQSPSGTPSADQAMAEMKGWLDQPVPNFPWYTTGGTFYSQGYSEITFSPFREFYTTSGTPVVGGIISVPIRFDIAQRTPSRIYYGTGQALPYSQYVSTVAPKANELWVQGATDWTQYVVSPMGTWLQLVANAPVGGPGGFYEIVQTDTNTLKYNTYQFYSGYNTMNFVADQVGRHMLYFVVNNQPSNVVVVDVFAQAQQGSMPPTSIR
jgi:hypothetical protein